MQPKLILYDFANLRGRSSVDPATVLLRMDLVSGDSSTRLKVWGQRDRSTGWIQVGVRTPGPPVPLAGPDKVGGHWIVDDLSWRVLVETQLPLPGRSRLKPFGQSAVNRFDVSRSLVSSEHAWRTPYGVEEFSNPWATPSPSGDITTRIMQKSQSVGHVVRSSTEGQSI